MLPPSLLDFPSCHITSENIPKFVPTNVTRTAMNQKGDAGIGPETNLKGAEEAEGTTT